MQLFTRIRDHVLSVPTLADLADLYLTESEHAIQAGEISASTFRCRRSGARLVRADLGEYRPTQLEHDQLVRWRRSYARQPSKWNHGLTCLRWSVKQGKLAGWLGRDPLGSISRLPCNKRQCRVLPDQIPAVLAELRRIEMYGRTRAHRSAGAACQLIAYTGGRHQEICKLRWDGVYPDRGLIHCGRSKTGQQARYGLTRQAVDLLRRRLDEAAGPYVFPGHRDDAPIHSVRKTWIRACEAVGISMVVHGLRHTWITEALGVAPIQQVALAVGHRSETITADYGHLTIEEIRPVIDLMSERFDALERMTA